MPGLRAALYTPATETVVNTRATQNTDRRSNPMLTSPGRRFAIANCVAVLPQLLVLYASSDRPSPFVLLVLLWNVAPIAMSAVFFIAGARAAAWGWLIAAGTWGLWEASSVVLSNSSTAFLALIWGPIWSLTIVGPIGAGIAILRARRLRVEKEREPPAGTGSDNS
jgi:hypothetical protein